MRQPANHILNGIASLILAICLGACDVHEFPCDDAPTDVECEVEVEINFDLEDMPWLTTIEYEADGSTRQIDTRSGSEAYDFRYQLFVFDGIANPSRTPVKKLTFTSSDLSNLSRTFRMRLKPGDYTVRVWADFVDHGSQSDKFYDTFDLTAITVKTDPNGDTYGCEHHRNAFLGTTTLSVPEEAFLYVGSDRKDGVYVVRARCDMDRPLARFEFQTTDIRKFLGDRLSPEEEDERLAQYTARVRYAGYMPSKFNLYTDRPVDAWLGMGFNSPISRLDDDSASMGFDYVFVGNADTSVELALDIYDNEGTKIASTDPINVPLRRNHYTLIRGDFLTAEAHGGVGIDPEFSGEYNIEIH